MKLYHGSNIEVKEPKILRSDRKLDFGPGFHLTSSLEQAQRWAELTAERRNAGHPVVTVYEFDETGSDQLKILRFESANRKWLNFIAANREGDIPESRWDLVIGPVANDRTMPVIRLFLAGVYTPSETLRRLQVQKLHDQYTFKTEISLQFLTFTEIIDYGRQK